MPKLPQNQTTTTRSSGGNLPFKWHGGKQYLAKKIIEHMPKHTHYVEPYLGGAAVLLMKPFEGVSEVGNDLNNRLMNFWSVLIDEEKFQRLKRLCEATPFSDVTWEEAEFTVMNSTDDVLVAWALFVKYRQSRQGLGKGFATLSKNRTRRAMNEQASSWLGAIEGLDDAHNRLKRVVLLSKPALEVIKSEDSPNTLFYLDPPYLHSTRTATNSYEYEMSEQDHNELLYTLAHISGKFILSGYPSELYDKFQGIYGWNTLTIPIRNHASSAKTKRIMKETLWYNYE